MLPAMNVVPYTASPAAPPYAVMMPAAWLSTISPAEAARKNTIHRRQNTARRRSPAAGASVAAAASVTRDCAMSHAASDPVIARVVASPASVARTPNARMDQPKIGAAIIAPAGYSATR